MTNLLRCTQVVTIGKHVSYIQLLERLFSLFFTLYSFTGAWILTPARPAQITETSNPVQSLLMVDILRTACMLRLKHNISGTAKFAAAEPVLNQKQESIRDISYLFTS